MENKNEEVEEVELENNEETVLENEENVETAETQEVETETVNNLPEIEYKKPSVFGRFITNLIDRLSDSLSIVHTAIASVLSGLILLFFTFIKSLASSKPDVLKSCTFMQVILVVFLIFSVAFLITSIILNVKRKNRK